MIKLCIFDLDGTVLDTIGTIAYYGNYALEKNQIAPIDVGEYNYLAGTGASNLVKNMLRFRQCLTEETYARVYADYQEAYNKDVAYQSKIFDGLKETLDKIKSMGVSLAIVSNKPDYAAKKVVEALYGKDYFVRVDGQKEGKPLKPDPKAVLDILSEFQVSKEECLYIGDTDVDMQTGKNAGIFTVGVLWGFRGEEELLKSGADLVVQNPMELYHHICGIL